MVVDDRAECPKVSQIELRFSGPVDHDTLLTSLAEAVGRHPMLQARLERTPHGDLRWVLPSEPQARVSMTVARPGLDASEVPDLGAPLDLFQTAGVRFGLVDTGQTLRLLIAVHHACTDGTGLFQFVEDLLVLYQRKSTSGAPAVALRERRPDRLRNRGQVSRVGGPDRPWWTDIGLGARSAYRVLKDTPDPLHPRRPPDDTPLVPTGRSPEDATDLLKPLRRAAARQGATLNDLLIRDLLLTVRTWNDQTAGHASDRRYRVLLPCDLRSPEHELMPAANAMSFAFVTRSLDELGDHDALLRGISGETRFIRTENASSYFLRALAVARRWEAGMRRLAATPWCLATVVLSNLGDPTLGFVEGWSRVDGKIAIGDVVLEWIRVRSPLRPRTRFGLVVNTYANQLSLGPSADPSQLTSDDIIRFLMLFRARLETSAGTAD